MLTVKRRQDSVSSLPKTRIGIYFNNNAVFILSIINLICKILVFIGLFITISSNHWAKNPMESDIYTGYKTRCSVHVCLSGNPDPTWLVDFIFVLAIINLFMELINVGIVWYFLYKLSKMDIILGLMFILTLIITDCGFVFGIHIIFYVYNLPMGYAFYCFIFSIIFSIIDWGFSLKRFISDWPETIYLVENEYKPKPLIRSTGDFPATSEDATIAPLN